MKLSKRKSAKRSYHKASHKKRVSPKKKTYYKKKASPKKKTSYKKKASPKKRVSGRRPRITFRFGDVNDVDPRLITEEKVAFEENILANNMMDTVDRPRVFERIKRVLESFRNKYFWSYLPMIPNADLYGNDAVHFVCQRLDITPEKLVSLIPRIAELEFESVTVARIKLLLKMACIRAVSKFMEGII